MTVVEMMEEVRMGGDGVGGRSLQRVRENSRSDFELS